MSETGNQDGAPASPIPIRNEFVERLRGFTPKVEAVETSAGTYYMRKRTGADRWRLLVVQDSVQKNGGRGLPPALIVTVSLMNLDGTPVFPNIDQGFTFCESLDSDVLDELFQAALRVTGLGKHALEDAEKKSSSSQSSDSGTTSQPS